MSLTAWYDDPVLRAAAVIPITMAIFAVVLIALHYYWTRQRKPTAHASTLTHSSAASASAASISPLESDNHLLSSYSAYEAGRRAYHLAGADASSLSSSLVFNASDGVETNGSSTSTRSLKQRKKVGSGNSHKNRPPKSTNLV